MVRIVTAEMKSSHCHMGMPGGQSEGPADEHLHAAGVHFVAAAGGGQVAGTAIPSIARVVRSRTETEGHAVCPPLVAARARA